MKTLAQRIREQKLHEQALLDIDNFWASDATISEKMEFSLKSMSKACDAIIQGCERMILSMSKAMVSVSRYLKSVAKGIMSRFSKRPVPTNRRLRDNFDLQANLFIKNWNSPITLDLMNHLDREAEDDSVLADMVDDEVGMCETLDLAREILSNTNHKK